MDRYILSLFHLDGRISVLRSVGIIDLEQCGIVASAICGDDVQIADLVEIAGAGTGHGIHDDRFGHNHAQGDRFSFVRLRPLRHQFHPVARRNAKRCGQDAQDEKRYAGSSSHGSIP